MASEIHRVIVGTAGHIDHGKSSLVRALTGIDPDRLKEEQERGMTIDLGFAPYRTAGGRTVGIIDVPGHERFVKNMVAGATSVDVFLLVVAADDGVMPQTREHVEILDLLGARRGLVAVTKVDLVDGELRELALAEIADWLGSTPFAGAPRIPVSTVSGEGLDALRRELDADVDACAPRSCEGLFRMPVQRVFSARGHGTVVTGVPVSGQAAPGDVLEVLPAGKRGRVRGIQAYREDRDGAAAGHSTALNLGDVDYREVRRGDVVATPGFFAAVRLLEARLRYLGSAGRRLKPGDELRLHVGTAEVLARVGLLDQPFLEPGNEALVQLRLREPVVAAAGDRFLVRQISPAVTVGGGVVVASSLRRLGARPEVVSSVRAKAGALADPAAYLEQLLLDRGAVPLPRREVAVALKLPPAAADAVLAGLLDAGRAVAAGRDKIVHERVFAGARERLRAALEAFHRAHPLKRCADALPLRSELRVGEELFAAVAGALVDEGIAAAEKGGRLRLAGAGPRLTPEQERMRDLVLGMLRDGGCSPPGKADLAARIGKGVADIQAMLALACEEGEVVRAGDVYFHRDAVERARAAAQALAAAAGGELSVPALRDALGTTRKFLIPLLEAFDAQGFTVRRGDRRFVVAAPGARSGGDAP